MKRGKTGRGTQRYLCQNTTCPPQSFVLEYRYRGRLPEVKQHMVDMRLNASGVRDTARVLRIRTDTVLRALRQKEAVLESVNTALLRTVDPDEMLVDMQQAGEAEMDEIWRFVGNSSPRRPPAAKAAVPGGWIDLTREGFWYAENFGILSFSVVAQSLVN